MIKFKISIVGSYPRSISLGKVFSRYRSGKIDKTTLDSEISKRTISFLNLAKDIGAHYTTDGLLRWDDIMDITFSYIKGPSKGELMRFFDNNFYYRKPVIKEEIKGSSEEFKKIVENDLELVKKSGYEGVLKIPIVGPLTYARLSDNRYYKTEEDLIFAYSKETNSVLRSLGDLVKAVEIHEPSFFEKGIKGAILSRLTDAYAEMLAGVNMERHLISYFNIISSRLNLFLGLPVDIYGFDVIENLGSIAQVYRRIEGKNVFFGVLNTRNTKLEKVSTIRRIVGKGYQKGAKEVYIGNAAPMDFIPEIIAVRKLKLLKKVGENK
ncbi:hypothetical protein GWK48_04875 [Metallosphaera tengchongensis]|uniref:Cobalamin-independent methionine synthase MetE N-terminal domain-containing protein n=1 Tax=Metallosphaera tengchongensis TaxID=1532350 RepID=A0A6N0NSY5_9CREN|nr:hypothetical protein [Metallosphaera tengchongensis]QKQ99811.1 hypothetical protein GWK48_04875 [Metallosphaera tengchongensis]